MGVGHKRNPQPVAATIPRMFRAWRELAPVPTVGIWAPSSPGPLLFPKRFERAISALKRAGFEPVLGRSCSNGAGPDWVEPKAAADDLKYLVGEKSVDVVMAAVGGWSMLPVLPHVDWDLLSVRRPAIVGYSDISVMLWACLTKIGLQTIHGPMAIPDFGEFGGPFLYSLDSMRSVLTPGGTGQLSAPLITTDEVLFWDREDVRPRLAEEATSWRSLRDGRCEGWLLPGCLPAVAQLFETSFMPPSTGAILCLETVGMTVDQVWACMSQWRLSGRLDSVAGLVIARHSQLRPSASGLSDVDKVILEVTRGLDIPILVDVDFGHTDPRLSLKVGGLARLDSGRGQIQIL